MVNILHPAKCDGRSQTTQCSAVAAGSSVVSSHLKTFITALFGHVGNCVWCKPHTCASRQREHQSTRRACTTALHQSHSSAGPIWMPRASCCLQSTEVYISCCHASTWHACIALLVLFMWFLCESQDLKMLPFVFHFAKLVDKDRLWLDRRNQQSTVRRQSTDTKISDTTELWPFFLDEWRDKFWPSPADEAKMNWWNFMI